MPKVGVVEAWPDEVDIPDAIGRSQFYVDGKPCCAIGHLQLLLPRGGPEERRWRQMYRIAASHVLGLPRNPPAFMSSSVERVNDSFCDEDQRLLLYAVAWGLCGYTEITGYPEAKRVLDEIITFSETTDGAC